MDEPKDQSSTKRTLIILGDIIGIFVILIGIVALTGNPSKRLVNTPEGTI